MTIFTLARSLYIVFNSAIVDLLRKYNRTKIHLELMVFAYLTFTSKIEKLECNINEYKMKPKPILSALGILIG